MQNLNLRRGYATDARWLKLSIFFYDEGHYIMDNSKVIISYWKIRRYRCLI